MAAAAGEHFTAHPYTRIGYVSLNVSDMPQSLEFYQSMLGFEAVGRPSGDRALLSSDGGNSEHLIELRKAAKPAGDKKKRAGLYHFAVLLPERKFLADALAHLAERRGRVHFDGMADHGVSESVYIRDPDFNGIEIYRDRPRAEWPVLPGGHIQMVTERLETEDLLAQATAAGWKGMPAGTTIGHVHLHVRDLDGAMQFYSQALGLGLTFALPGAYFFAAGNYHHHVAANTWLGKDLAAASPEEEVVGLNHFAIKVPDEKELQRATSSLSSQGVLLASQERGSATTLHDSDGIAVKLYK
ncbi:MAG: VOC family protein [Nitrososphaera sp.]